jgi:NAD(P)-dependent dehydrogenase (short-subunit alcohol dehydrogenase family)
MAIEAPADPLSTFHPDLFAGTVALVTGGGTGIGKATATGFARLGADLVLAGRRADLLEAAAAELRERFGRRVLAVPTNIREPSSVEALRDAAYDELGRVDHLVNNAGGQFPSLPSQLSDNGWRSVVDLNLNGTWTMVNRFMTPMVEAGQGSIITMVHTYVFDRGARFFVHSGAARAGVLSLTRTMASFLAPHGVTVNAIAPGLIDTSGMREHEGEAVEAMDIDALGELGLKTTRRMGTVDEVAAGIVWLASPGARYVTGTVAVVDGGLVLDNWPDPWERDAF